MRAKVARASKINKNKIKISKQTQNPLFFRFRAIFVHFIPCVSLVILNYLLFRAMKEAEKKREKLLNSNPKVNLNRRETKESKKIRDANTTTLMLIVVISVSQYYMPQCRNYRISLSLSKIS